MTTPVQAAQDLRVRWRQEAWGATRIVINTDESGDSWDVADLTQAVSDATAEFLIEEAVKPLAQKLAEAEQKIVDAELIIRTLSLESGGAR